MIHRAVWMEAEQTDPYINLAIEQQLMRELPQDTAALCLWQNAHTIVIGRNQDPFMECRAEAFMADGGRIARRLSGGGAVYHDLGNLNYTFVLPQESFDIPAQMEIVLRAVASFGLMPRVDGRNDLVIDGRKFSGNAFQIRQNKGCHHGTLLLHADTQAMAKWLTADKSKMASHGVKSVTSRIVNLQSLCSAADVDTVKRAMIAAFGAAYGLPPVRMTQQELDMAAVQETAAQLASQEWLFPDEETPADKGAAARFGWGSLRVCIWLQGNRICRARLRTDALCPQLFLDVEDALCGACWNEQDVMLRFESLMKTCTQARQRVMLQDMAGWIKTFFDGTDKA